VDDAARAWLGLSCVAVEAGAFNQEEAGCWQASRVRPSTRKQFAVSGADASVDSVPGLGAMALSREGRGGGAGQNERRPGVADVTGRRARPTGRRLISWPDATSMRCGLQRRGLASVLVRRQGP